ncbi:MAG TPA: ABC transporter permease [Methanomassiliicoccales archaeon]|nr:ABC transporter permease [Methanomassiliicoccales archaeon]
MSETRVKVIRPRSSRLDLGLNEIWEYRELLYFLVWKNVKIRYKQSVVGAAWAVIQPLFTMLIFTFLLGGIVKVDTEGIPYPIYSFAGLVLWTYFSNSVNQGANSLITNAPLVTKVYFPRALIPLSACVSGLLDLFIATIILVIMMFFFHASITIVVVLFLVPVILAFFLAAGLSLWLSAVNVRYRDVVFLVPFFIQLLLFASPILYSGSNIPAKYDWILYFNPMAGIMSLQRGVYLGLPVDWLFVGLAVIITAALFVAGLYYFRQYERDFADVI